MAGAEPLGPSGGSAPGRDPGTPPPPRDDIDDWAPPAPAAAPTPAATPTPAPAPALPDDDLEHIAPLALDDEDDDPLLAPDPARAAFWLGAGELERGSYFHASRSFKAAAEHSAAPPGGAPADPARVELARGLFHLAVAGFKGLAGDPPGKQRQLAHARRRLAPFGPRHDELDLELADLLAAVEADERGPADAG